jgi:hypothetical protein
MPVVATGTPGQLGFAANDETALTALDERLVRADVQVELEHEGLRS